MCTICTSGPPPPLRNLDTFLAIGDRAQMFAFFCRLLWKTGDCSGPGLQLRKECRNGQDVRPTTVKWGRMRVLQQIVRRPWPQLHGCGSPHHSLQ